jgi:uncharacterized protein (TIGR00299 family) protein
VTRLCYLDSISGIAGDMLLGALLDAGGSIERLREVPALLELADAEVDVDREERHGIGALRVRIGERNALARRPSSRPFAEINRLIGRSALPPRVQERSMNAFRRLAEAEAKIHGTAVDEVHFHELGSVDTLIDICGTMMLLDDLEIDQVAASPLPYSRGLVDTAHGTLPVPAPATLELLVGIPLTGVETEGELVTPTGAAIAATVVDSWGALPPLTPQAVGYGAGASDFADRPNLLRIVVGSSQPSKFYGQVSLLETNLDDLNPELVPDAVERCFAAGALDVWTSPAQMKKGRPGFVLSALARSGQEAEVARAIFEETSSLGLRIARMQRYELEREERTVVVQDGTVRVKVGRLDGRVVNVVPEHDDCAALARETGRSVKAIWAAALAATESQ